MRAALTLLLVLVAALASAATATAPGPPRRGVLVEGKTFGGLPLGLTQQQVRARWGKRFGVCDNCKTPTWYYNFLQYDAHAVGVEFRLGRVDQYFTLGAPKWRTRKGLRVDSPKAAIATLYGQSPTIECKGYEVAQIVTGRALLFVYLSGDKVYGLGLAARSVSPCR
jgi:outer membrane protein assembly factor BamE (lipoprotein component of BamABCDE complex)